MAKKSELINMGYSQAIEISKGVGINTAFSVKEAVVVISSRVQQKYGLINPETIPDHANYATIEKFLRSVNIEITYDTFTSCIKEQLPPNKCIKNSNHSLYTHEQILYYILVDMFMTILPLGKIKHLVYDVLRLMIYIIGLDATYVRLCENICTKVDGVSSTVLLTPQDDIQTVQQPYNHPENAEDAVVQAIGSIAYYTKMD